MLDLGTLRLGIKVDSGEAKAQLNDVSGAVEGTGGKVTDLASKAKMMIKAFAAAWAVKELVKLGKAALDAYAEYEQLEGGVKKLFGEEASQDIMKYADRAYKTAGISANEYLQQATSFSASLISSLNGDQKKAAEITDMAIQDMADNANVFGTDIASIQNAYQGFAKQNYTMLDNLKLGYGGTKQEMERLLEDAEKLSGQEYDISNLSDVYEAIHVVQEEMQITGTTSKEAATTIEGSTRQM
ncbi:MAG: phage tail protein, partial [Spirochaetales bacterium]|nr:phage tail protein [Spirochaetales bacterium]